MYDKNITFGDLIKELRKKKNWTVKDLNDRLKERIGKTFSHAYITQIEVHNEIPKADMICALADILGYDSDKLLSLARENRVIKYSQSLTEKYQKAHALYKKQKK
jgi:transcriptional regulator with XRE-family HTH domain